MDKLQTIRQSPINQRVYITNEPMRDMKLCTLSEPYHELMHSSQRHALWKQ